MRILTLFLSLVFVLAGCGGGGSSSNNQSTAPQTGSITVLVGDNPLADIEQVLIDIREVRLLGDDGQVTITDGPVGVIDLLSLQNLTELIASDEVPAGDYSKIRLFIDSLQVVEKPEMMGGDLPGPIDVQLPANGKIDLNPQGEFEVLPGEALVVQIDIDLARSIKLVQTGNSKYRFRPIVFVDVQDLRLTRLFGELSENDDIEDDQKAGEPSDYDLCLTDDQEPCVDVVLSNDLVVFNADGMPSAPADLVLPENVHVFGSYFIGDGGKQFFRANLIAVAPEDGLTRIDGEVNSEVVDDAFELIDDADVYNVLTDDALLLDNKGADLTFDISPGQDAEAWALQTALATADADDFPAILVQVENEADDVDDEDSIEGVLADLDGNTLTVRNDDGDSCVTIDENTEIQLLSDYNGDAETDVISRVALGDLISTGVEVEAFGDVVGDCLEANVIAAEIED